MKTFYFIVLSAVVATMMGSPVGAVRRSTLGATGPVASSGISALNLPDPHKELRHLSKDLKLKKDQRTGVGFILEERTREINLLIDIQSLSQEHRDTLAAIVVEESDAQIEALLRSKQKRKFDKELTKDREMR